MTLVILSVRLLPDVLGSGDMLEKFEREKKTHKSYSLWFLKLKIKNHKKNNFHLK